MEKIMGIMDLYDQYNSSLQQISQIQIPKAIYLEHERRYSLSNTTGFVYVLSIECYAVCSLLNEIVGSMQ